MHLFVGVIPGYTLRSDVAHQYLHISLIITRFIGCFLVHSALTTTMADLVPETVKSTLQSAAGKAQQAVSVLPDTVASLGGLANTYHHDHQKGQAHSSHRNAQAEEHHTRNPNAPKDLGEFIETQLVGKINNDALAKQFPTVEGMWHGYIDVSNSRERFRGS